MWYWKCISIWLVFVIVAWCRPQEQNIEDVVADIFATTRAPRRGGFDVIVTPEPIVEPTSAPQILQNNQGNRCICVPYFLCDPENGTIRTDGSFDGFGIIDIRFDPQTCQDVLDVCCTEDRRRSEPVTPPPTPAYPDRPTGCGIRNVQGIDFQITGNFNNEANFGEFPWTAALIAIPEQKCLCVGSLIHPSVILTGSHCVFDKQPQQIKVRVGEWDTQTTKERLPFQEEVVSQIITHPDFNRKTLANDVALVIVEQPYEIADHINTICLPPQDYVSTSRDCYASGWGKDVFGKAGKYSVIMKRVRLPIVQHDQCEASLRSTRLGTHFNLSPTFICAGGEKGVDTCEGDGGAPLVCPIGPESENRYSQSGIVAWGIGCNEDRPAVYANVALARNWIDAQMDRLGLDKRSYTY